MSRRFLGPVRRFEEIDSTNLYLTLQARAGVPSGLVAIAAYQTAGRGRLDRTWEAPAGSNLLMSVMLRPRTSGDRQGPGGPGLNELPVALALAASDACGDAAGVTPGLKWPNDLVVDSTLDPESVRDGPKEVPTPGALKLAGILSELVVFGAQVEALVMGIGLNVGWPAAGPRQPDLPGATSLSRLSDRSVDPDALAEAVLDRLDHRIVYLNASGGAERQAAEYKGRCVTIGLAVRVEETGGSFLGTAVDLTEEGKLVVEDSQGGRRVVAAGDVVHLRHLRSIGGPQSP